MTPEERRKRKRRDALATDPANVKLIRDIAQRIHAKLPPSFELDDLISEGTLGLMDAVEKYDPKNKNGTPFRVFARKYIRGAALDSVRRKRYTENTRASIDAPDDFNPYSIGPDDQGDLTLRFATVPARGMARLAHQPVCEQRIDRLRLNARVSEALSWLPKEEHELLKLWYSDEEPHIFTLAGRLGLTVTAAQALHTQAIQRLRALLEPCPARKRGELKVA